MNDTLPAKQEHTLQAYSANLNNSLQFASMLVQTQMVPAHFKKPQEVVAAILYGQELGFTPMQALQSVVVIQGKPALDTNAIKALVSQAGGRFETLKWTDQECSLRGIRGEWKEEFTFTMSDATTMGLANKDNWKRMPKQMLYARCVSMLARNMWADVLKGFYGKEEIMDELPQKDPVKIRQVEKAVVVEETGEVIAEKKEIFNTELLWAYEYDALPKNQKTTARELLKKAGGVNKPDGLVWTTQVVPELEGICVRYPGDEPETTEGE